MKVQPAARSSCTLLRLNRVDLKKFVDQILRRYAFLAAMPVYLARAGQRAYPAPLPETKDSR